jgi:hypothetical protein
VAVRMQVAECARHVHSIARTPNSQYRFIAYFSL